MKQFFPQPTTVQDQRTGQNHYMQTGGISVREYAAIEIAKEFLKDKHESLESSILCAVSAAEMLIDCLEKGYDAWKEEHGVPELEEDDVEYDAQQTDGVGQKNQEEEKVVEKDSTGNEETETTPEPEPEPEQARANVVEGDKPDTGEGESEGDED